jgi:hypothetical protein
MSFFDLILRYTTCAVETAWLHNITINFLSPHVSYGKILIQNSILKYKMPKSGAVSAASPVHLSLISSKTATDKKMADREVLNPILK